MKGPRPHAMRYKETAAFSFIKDRIDSDVGQTPPGGGGGGRKGGVPFPSGRP